MSPRNAALLATLEESLQRRALPAQRRLYGLHEECLCFDFSDIYPGMVLAVSPTLGHRYLVDYWLIHKDCGWCSGIRVSMPAIDTICCESCEELKRGRARLALFFDAMASRQSH